MKFDIKLSEKKILYIFTMCILIFVPIFLNVGLYLQSKRVMAAYYLINASIVYYFSLPFLIGIYIYNLCKSKRKKDIFDYLLYILLFAGLVVSIFSVNKDTNFFGNIFRREGLLVFYSYYFLIINWKNYGSKKDYKFFKKFIYFFAALNSIYAILQLYTNFSWVIRFIDNKSASGLCGNSNFLGSLMVTAISIITTDILIHNNNNIKKYLLFILFFIGLVDCQSTGPFLSYIVFLFFISVFLFIKKYKIAKKFLFIILILIVTYLGLMYFNNYMFKKLYGGTRCEMCDIGNTIDTGGTYRLTIWEYTLEAILKRPITGAGFDNLIYVYPHQNYKLLLGENIVINDKNEVFDGGYLVDDKDVSDKVGIVDNAHNVYLNIWANCGLITLIPYLILCLLTFIKGLKSNNKDMFIFLSGFVAYSVQAFANINVIYIASIYYIIIGLMLSVKEEL